MLTWWRSRDNKKDEDNVYMRWEKDEDLEPLSPLGLFDEYLEMGKRQCHGAWYRALSENWCEHLNILELLHDYI